jgi:hypothetical protein
MAGVGLADPMRASTRNILSLNLAIRLGDDLDDDEAARPFATGCTGSILRGWVLEAEPMVAPTS